MARGSKGGVVGAMEDHVEELSTKSGTRAGEMAVNRVNNRVNNSQLQQKAFLKVLLASIFKFYWIYLILFL